MSVEIIDLSNYRDRTGSRVPEDDYVVEVSDIEIGESKAGAPMWTVYLQIVGGPMDGMSLVDRLTLTDKAMFRVVGFLNGMGVKTSRKRMKVDTARLVGRKAIVTVSDGEPYNGSIRSEVRGYTRYVSPTSEDAVADLDDVDGDEEAPAAPAPAKTAEAADTSSPFETPDEAPVVNDDSELDLDDLDEM